MKQTQIVRKIRDILRKEFQRMYQSSENAYSALDFSGIGYITRESFFNNFIVKHKIKFSKEDIEEFLKGYNLFNSSEPGINFDNFKKVFFPHLYLVQDDKDDLYDDQAKNIREYVLNNKEDLPQIIKQRLLNLEKKIKDKFQNQFESVRKAFLLLDIDYDGFIVVEDILRYLGNESDLNFNDLTKLFKEKDSTGKGRINYSDFSKWLGSAIHMSEGFAFRHDSVKNP
jgi:Ca2+-binding EF-hand superfamily protein